eukprot:1151273-Pelagomonas_calceolata.AAC.7
MPGRSSGTGQFCVNGGHKRCVAHATDDAARICEAKAKKSMPCVCVCVCVRASTKAADHYAEGKRGAALHNGHGWTFNNPCFLPFIVVQKSPPFWKCGDNQPTWLKAKGLLDRA